MRKPNYRNRCHAHRPDKGKGSYQRNRLSIRDYMGEAQEGSGEDSAGERGTNKKLSGGDKE